MRRLLTLTLAVLLVASRAWAGGDVTIVATGVSVEPNDRRLLHVLFDIPRPEPTDVLATSQWSVTTREKGGAVRHVSVVGAAIQTCVTTSPGAPPAADASRASSLLPICAQPLEIAEVTLQLSDEIATTVEQLVLTYAGPGGIQTLLVTDASQLGIVQPSARTPFTAAKQDDADVFFKGSLTRARGTDASFDVEAFAGYMYAIAPARSAYFGRIGFYGEAKTKESARIDPDSLLAYFVYQRVLGSGGFAWKQIQSPLLNFRFAGWEFDRKGDQRNFVVSPVVSIPVRLSAAFLGPIEPGVTVPRLMVHLGTEFVHQSESALAPTGKWHTRGLLGLTFAAGVAPERPLMHAFEAKGSYYLRALSSAEVFKDPSHAPIDPATSKRGDPIAELGSQPRHRAEFSFTYQPLKWIGVTVEYAYGSLPPVFTITDHSVTFGVSFALKQSSYGRFAILRP